MSKSYFSTVCLSGTEEAKLKKQIILAAVILACGAGTAMAMGLGSKGKTVEKLLHERLPKTKITSVDCQSFGSFCEVVAGKSIFYTDTKGRYLVIGRVYDLDERKDLTASRLIELDPGALIGGAARANEVVDDSDRSADLVKPGLAGPPKHVDISKLSSKGAIKWGKGGMRATVFTDFRCGYCKMLVKTLEQMKVTVTERPISILGSRAISEAVICAPNPKKALRAAYAGRNISKPNACDTSGLDENEKFARANGIAGTPFIVRSDGAVMSGFRDRRSLENWLKGGSK